MDSVVDCCCWLRAYCGGHKSPVFHRVNSRARPIIMNGERNMSIRPKKGKMIARSFLFASELEVNKRNMAGFAYKENENCEGIVNSPACVAR